MGIIVYNTAKGTTLSHSADVISSTIGKARGLMFFFHPKTLVMRFSSPCIISLHMFFVFHPIDVLWLGEDNRVVEALEWFRPFSVYTPCNKAVSVVEMPAGTIKKSKTRIGDVLWFSTPAQRNDCRHA